MPFLVAMLFSVMGHTNEFSELDLRTHLAGQEASLIYVYSPHMPLSIMGRAEARSVAAELQIAFLELIDPYTIGCCEAALRLKSETLLSLGVLEHFPTVVVTANGRVQKRILQGYEPLEGLKKFVEDTLQRRED